MSKQNPAEQTPAEQVAKPVLAENWAELSEFALQIALQPGQLVTQIHFHDLAQPWEFNSQGAAVHSGAESDFVVTTDGKVWPFTRA